jgi:hypothetical protein
MTHTPVLLAAAVVAAALAAEIIPTPDTLVVHEWGTFTSVAGESGDAVAWAPLIEPPDLPCFVNRISRLNVKAVNASVRMETPVLYFYPQHDMTLSVHVAFPQGWITEWYPHATRVTPQPDSKLNFVGNYQNGQIDWDALQVSLRQSPEFPVGKGPSRYYAARHTDSAPIAIAGQHEKMIFYRGVGNFSIPLRPAFDSQGMLELHNTDADSVPTAMLFENRDGRLGYRIVRDVKGVVKIAPPEMTGTATELRSSLADALVKNGLYPKEAAAMIETWHDSWFESGARLIYIVPRPMVDAVLPLKIAPAATSLSRVFVGRIEILSPAVRRTIETALTAGDVPTLAKLGRFLDPFVAQIQRSRPAFVASKEAARFLGEARIKVWQAFDSNCIE